MSFFGDIFAGKSQQAAANYNAKIQERNAQIKEQEAKQIMSVHNEYSLPKFDKTSASSGFIFRDILKL